MPKNREKAVRASEPLLPASGRLLLLGALALVILPQLPRMPLWLSAACVGVFAWRLLHELRGWAMPGRWQRTLLVLTGFGAVLWVYRGVIGLEPGVALLSVMLCFKLLELNRLRDAMVSLFMGYFMVIGSFFFDQSLLMGGYLLLAVLLLTAAMVAVNHPAGSLRESRHYLRTGGGLLLQSLPLMLLLFVLFPRLDNPLWAMPEEGEKGRTGLSETLEMGSISELVDSNEVAFRVDFDGPMPPASQLYWRGPVLWESDGRRWSGLYLQPRRELPEFEAQGQPLSYEISLEPSRRLWLFALDMPLQLPEGLSDPVGIRADMQLLSARELRSRQRYRISSSLEYRLEPDEPLLSEQALQLPRARNPQSRRLAEAWRTQGLDDGAIVAAALAMFREQAFFYTRQPPRLGEDAVDEFLFGSQRGFCEHYAASFVTLMRAAGVPARLVTGYQGGELNPVGNYLIVRQSHAHAWAEVWLDEQGWVRVDPTSVIPPERVEDAADSGRFEASGTSRQLGDAGLFGRMARQLRNNWDALNHRWDRWVQGFDRARQQELLQMLGLAGWSWQWLVGAMVGGFVLLLLPVAIWLLRQPRPKDPVQRLYGRFCRKLARIGLERATNEGASDFSARVIAARPDLQRPVRRITGLYQRLRYGGRAQDAASLAQLRQELARWRPRRQR
ncbi:MAG: DUF3488 and transglutaminase-like domain-containing protein [Chromatiales bacterium]|nr:DUF3488 domain-containing transglutaminase family protein [Gammaproteobacteria bacterium]MBW6477169.1 DUF3488 and transglutaminase-like domain-containing protein [Chromatiales bacterium]